MHEFIITQSQQPKEYQRQSICGIANIPKNASLPMELTRLQVALFLLLSLHQNPDKPIHLLNSKLLPYSSSCFKCIPQLILSSLLSLHFSSFFSALSRKPFLIFLSIFPPPLFFSPSDLFSFFFSPTSFLILKLYPSLLLMTFRIFPYTYHHLIASRKCIFQPTLSYTCCQNVLKSGQNVVQNTPYLQTKNEGLQQVTIFFPALKGLAHTVWTNECE